MTTHVRIPPADADALSAAQLDALGPLASRQPLDNIFATLVRHPDLFASYLGFGLYMLNQSTLPAAVRELAILQVAVRTGCEYEFAQHYRPALRAGLLEQDISRLVNPEEVGAWAPEHRVVIEVVTELLNRHSLTDRTWSELTNMLDTHQVIDLIFTVGSYAMLAGALNTFGVELDEFLSGHPWPRRHAAAAPD